MKIYSLDPVMYSGIGADMSILSMRPAMYGGLGEHPWMSSLQCENYLKLVETYTRLSQKTDKTPATRANAEKLAAQYQSDYNTCMERKANQAVAAILQPGVPVVSPAVSPVVSPLTPALPIPDSLVPTTGVPAATTAASVFGEGWFTTRNIVIGAGVVAAGAAAVYFIKKRRRGGR
jgi:hypothetical protein